MSSSANLSPEFLAELSRTLRHHGVRHGLLREGAPYLNLNAADRSHVFVKVARAGQLRERAGTELVGAQWATREGINTCTPLVNDVLHVSDESGTDRCVTVWQWLEPVTAPALYDQAHMVADLLVEVARTPAPEQVSCFDPSYYVKWAQRRLEGRTDAAASAILDAINDTASRIRTSMDPARHVWIHGDLHFENVLWQVTGRPALLDWESHLRGPVEFDIAQMMRSVYLHFPKHAESEKVRVVRAMKIRLDDSLDVDWALVEQFGRFRAASSASHLLIHGHDARRLSVEMSMLDMLPFKDALAA